MVIASNDLLKNKGLNLNRIVLLPKWTLLAEH